MNWLQALILGMIQGLTEFLPVSSSAHMKLAKFFLGVSETGVLFDLMCHLGTLSVLLWYLRKDIIQLFLYERKKIKWFFIALVPLVPCYFLLKPVREYFSQIQFLGISLCVTAGLLYLGTRVRFNSGKGWKDILMIGTMQSVALIPGISRSASTISTASMLGWSAKEAVRFSFLLSIPTIMGGNLLEIIKVAHTESMEISSCLIGFLSSLGIGAIVIGFSLPLLEKGIFKPFAWYCFILGGFTLVYMNFYG